MALILSAATGNFNAGATWVGGVVPGVGDEARAENGHTITITANVTCDEVSNAGTGIFTLNNGVTLTANVTAKSTTANRNVVEFTAASPATGTIVGNVLSGATSTSTGAVQNTSSGSLTIIGNVTGGGTFGFGAHNASSGTLTITGNVISGNGSESRGANNASSGTLTITGNVTGGSNGNNPHGANNAQNGTLTITGNVTGGSGGTNPFAANNASTGTLTITGNVTGGSGGTNPFGANNNSTGTMTITGNCTGGTGSTNSHGAQWNAGGNGTIDGNLTGSLFGAGAVVQGTHSATAQVDILPGKTITAGAYAVNGASGAFYPGLRTGLRSRVRVPSTIVNGTGGQPAIEGIFFRDATLPYTTYPLTLINVSNVVTTQTMYAAGQSPGGIVASDLRSGVSLDNGAIIGTLAVPAANQVAVGVAVDNTIGTAVLTASTLRAAIGMASANLDVQLSTISTIDNNVDAVASVVNSLDARVPATLIGGRMDASVGAMAANTLTSSAIASSALTQSKFAAGAIRVAGDEFGNNLVLPALALEATSQSIKAKTDLISSGGLVTTNSPVTTTGSLRPIVIGDDYLAANGRAFTWTVTAITGITAATATAYFGGTGATTSTVTWLVTGTVTDNGNGTWTISCDMPRTTSATLTEQQYEWTLGVQAAGGTRVTPVRWGERVQAVESHTW